MLPFLLDSGQLTPEMMRAVTEVLAPFHGRAELLRKEGAVHYPSTVQDQWTDNLAELQPFFRTSFEADWHNRQID